MKLAIIVACIAFSSAPLVTFAHGHHEGHGPLRQAQPSTPAEAQAFQAISVDYLAKVQSIFDRKCANCHGSQTVYPWYYHLPGVKQYIDHDVRTAHHHLDFSRGFPFLSHASPDEDLDAIHDEISEGDMPPWDYRLMHRSAGLTDEEKKSVLDWVDRSEARLAETKPEQKRAPDQKKGAEHP